MLRKKQAMAAQFVAPTLEEMSKFILRSWRALRPKQGSERREVYYDLALSDNVVIRVWTSIGAGQETAADVGADAIRIQLLAKKGGRSWPLTKGKSPIVKRTQGWKNNLQDRVEDFIELYEEKEAIFEAQATGNPVRAPEPERTPERTPDHTPDRTPERDEDDDERGDGDPEYAPARSGRPEANATFTKLRSGEWGLRVEGAVKSGDKVIAKRQSGQAQILVVGEVVWRGQDRGTYITVTTISKSRMASGVSACDCGGSDGVTADKEPCAGDCTGCTCGGTGCKSAATGHDYSRP